MQFTKNHYDTEGPLGIPMKDTQAAMLDTLLKSLPAEDREVARLVTTKKPTELLEGERADVSWITTEEIDRDREIVIARGMNDSQFKLNPVVTLGHCYSEPPVGKSVWRKRATDGDLRGIKAKTQYHKRPTDWPTQTAWTPDQVFSLIQLGAMQGKSIGFLRLKSHTPSSHEIAALPALAQVSRIIDEWLLVEYAVCYLPTNQNALVEAVSKGLVTTEFLGRFGLKADGLKPPPAIQPSPLPAETIAYTSEDEISALIGRHLAGTNAAAIINDAINRVRGKV